MEKWKMFERESLKYLKNNYEKNKSKFELKGSSDSTISDIKVLNKVGDIFFIEVKMSEAQSGQFVLLDKNNRFQFSPKNKSEENEVTNLIKENINKNYELYKNVGTKAIKINLSSSKFSIWITEYYKKKGVEFIISKFKKEFIIVPIDKFENYFEISASLRRKKSGSRSLSKKYIGDINNYFKGFEIVTEDKKTYLISLEHKDKEQFEMTGKKFQLSLKKFNRYEIRMLGKTNNSNVIFSIKTKKKQDQKDLNIFKKKI